MDFGKANKIRMVLSLIGITIIIIGMVIQNYVGLLIGSVLFLVSTVIWIIYGKCPHCGKHLGKYVNVHCPHCGDKLK